MYTLCGMSDSTVLDRVVQYFGSQLALARACNLSTGMAVTQWRKRGVPPQHCLRIERLTKGAVCCEDLRPDLDWAVLRCARGADHGSI